MPKLFRVVIPVPEMERAISFYRAVLGQDGTAVDPTRYYLDCGATILVLADPSAHGRSFLANPELVYFAVSDLESAFQRAQVAGAAASPDDEVGWGIQTRPWGERSFYIRDPFGNPLCFVDEKTLFTGAGKRE